MSTVFSRLFENAKKIYCKQLLVSNTLSTMALLGVGDILTQYVDIRLTRKAIADQESQRKKLDNGELVSEKAKKHQHDLEFIHLEKFDWTRTAKVCGVGLLTGPFGHYWYSFLDGRYPHKNTKSALKKVFFDHTIASPIFTISFIFIAHMLDGKHFMQAYEIFKEKFIKIYVIDTLIWPASQLINFFFVPNAYRLLYVNGMSVVWNAILSYLLFDEGEESPLEKPQNEKPLDQNQDHKN